jgi:hypothetical protein
MAKVLPPFIFDENTGEVYTVDANGYHRFSTNIGPLGVSCQLRDSNNIEIFSFTSFTSSMFQMTYGGAIFLVDMPGVGAATLLLPALVTTNPHVGGQAWLNAKVLTVCDFGTQQVETATVTETSEGTLTAGNVTVIVTAAGMTGSPRTISVAVATNDSSNTVAGKIRTALAADSDVSAFFAVTPTATNYVILTTIAASPAANDATLNIDVADGTSAGIAVAHTSANTTAGAIPS